MKINSIFLVLFATLSAQAAELQYHGYMRAPVGTNSSGGKQVLLNNPGSQGNEFRLGNESGYGEAFFVGHFADGKGEKIPYFDAHLAFAYNPSMNSQYSDTAATGDQIQFVEAYAKGGYFDNLPMSFWAGKRFYRDGDVHMNDFFYFANMSGNGGGIEDYEISNGKLSLALLQYVDDRSLTGSTTGNPAKHALDFRWRDFKVSDSDSIEFWLAQGYTGPGKGATVVTTAAPVSTPVDYQASSGTVAGVKWTKKMGEGTNNFAIVYGTGVMESLTLDSTAYAANDSVKKKKRARLVENYSTELNEKWAIQAALAYEDIDSGAATKNKSSWTSIGVRPMYYFTDHFRLQFEAGYSLVKNEAETGANGSSAGDRSLTRITLAPEVAFGKGYYTRPVVRFFVTHSFWNDANKDTANTGSMISQLTASNAAQLKDKNSETQSGFEAEVWF